MPYWQAPWYSRKENRQKQTYKWIVCLLKNSLETGMASLTSGLISIPFLWSNKSAWEHLSAPWVGAFVFSRSKFSSTNSMSGNESLEHYKQLPKIARFDVFITPKYNSSRRCMFISAPGLFRMQRETKQSEKEAKKITMLRISTLTFFNLPSFLKEEWKSSVSKVRKKGAKNTI